MWLTDFRPQKPAHFTEQGPGLDWLADAHAEAERHLAGTSEAGAAAAAAFDARIHKVMKRVACGPDRIARRGHELAEFLHRDWSEMKIYGLGPSTPHGAGTAARMEVFASLVNRIIERAYPAGADEAPPDHLMHVTCTGYVSPSGAQALVAERGWADKTRVSHAYHMGCYAALPAVRQAMGLAHVLLADGQPTARVDLVHTELCTLHLDPGDHSPEQLVVQSLFADGSIRYTLRGHADRAAAMTAPRLRVLTVDDVMAPGTGESMTWRVGDHGMRMTLSREVPGQVGQAIHGFVDRLAQRVGMTTDDLRAKAIFAVHPGGPKIIEQVADQLHLGAEQVAHSRAVLLARGNMSSATLPHVWSDLLEDRAVPDGQMVVTLAFGPGLTLAGGVLRVER
jgi:predicted naringenin-chalcone synthase